MLAEKKKKTSGDSRDQKVDQCVLGVGERGEESGLGERDAVASWPGWLEIPAAGMSMALEKYPVLRAPREVSASRASERSMASRSFSPHLVQVAFFRVVRRLEESRQFYILFSYRRLMKVRS
jgi:hypothetical protein